MTQKLGRMFSAIAAFICVVVAIVPWLFFVLPLLSLVAVWSRAWASLGMIFDEIADE